VIKKIATSAITGGHVVAAIVEDNDIGPEFAGDIVLVDSEGYLIPVFGSANVADSLDDLFQFRGDGRWAVAHFYGMSAGEKATVRVLHIVPVDRNQQPVLSVIVGPPYGESCAGHYWGWRVRDDDNDGIPEIELGPYSNAKGDIAPDVTYRWSRAEGRYVGPTGSAEKGFLRFDETLSPEDKGHCCFAGGKLAEEFAKARSRLPERGDPRAVRKSECLSFESSGVIP
jgi:hypothetical protein